MTGVGRTPGGHHELPMRTRHAASALLAASAAAATLAACGGSSSKDDAASGTPASSGGSSELILAKAATATEQAKTAAVSIEQRISGAGTPKPITLTATGTTSLSRPELDLTYDLAPLLRSFGQSAGDGKARIVVDGSRVDVDPPAVPGLTIPNGATWVRIDLRAAVQALGLDPDALAATAQFDPASQLKRLQSLKGIRKSGTTTVDGTEVTKYAGTISARDALATLPASQRTKIEQSLEKLGGSASLDQKSATEIDVDADGLVRRQVTSTTIPSQGGTGGGKIDHTITYSDFGKALDPPTPSGSEVFDATSLLKQGLGGLASGGGAPGVGVTTTP